MISAYEVAGSLVSSSSIRAAIREGNVGFVKTMLGREFSISGRVIKGDNRGKSLGFATSNLDVSPEVVNVQSGVYVSRMLIEGKYWPAVTNIGFRPTFGDDLSSPRIEAHLLDFSGDLYDQEVELFFVDRLRDEMKFSTVEDLITQVKQDVAQTRRIFGLG